MTLPAATICALYKTRWQVEPFFKWINRTNYVSVRPVPSCSQSANQAAAARGDSIVLIWSATAQGRSSATRLIGCSAIRSMTTQPQQLRYQVASISRPLAPRSRPSAADDLGIGVGQLRICPPKISWVGCFPPELHWRYGMAVAAYEKFSPETPSDLLSNPFSGKIFCKSLVGIQNVFH